MFLIYNVRTFSVFGYSTLITNGRLTTPYPGVCHFCHEARGVVAAANQDILKLVVAVDHPGVMHMIEPFGGVGLKAVHMQRIHSAKEKRNRQQQQYRASCFKVCDDTIDYASTDMFAY